MTDPLFELACAGVITAADYRDMAEKPGATRTLYVSPAAELVSRFTT